MEHQFDPVENKYVYSLHHCGYQSVSLIHYITTLLLHDCVICMYACMCTVYIGMYIHHIVYCMLYCTILTMTYNYMFSLSDCGILMYVQHKKAKFEQICIKVNCCMRICYSGQYIHRYNAISIINICTIHNTIIFCSMCSVVCQ